MLKQVSKPVLGGTKFKDLVILTVDFEQAVNQCNAQLQAVSDFDKKQEPSTVDGF